MTERDGYGYRYRDEPGGGERPSGRGAVAERRAGQDEEVREIDLTDEAADREEAAAAAAVEADAAERGAVDDATAAPGAEAGEALPSERETSGSFEPHPTGAAPAATGTSIFDDGREEDAAETQTPGPPEPAIPDPAAVAAETVAAATAQPTTAAAEPAAPAAAALDAEGIRNRFLDIQAGFVDEPRQAVEEAGRLVEELSQQVIDALQAQRGQLQVPVAEASTEDLRLALRSYRQFVDRLLGLGL
jgi:hypothetical protein